MKKHHDRKIILVTRQTRLEEIIQRHHTTAQAQFYIEHLGADFSDYLKENEMYSQSLRAVVDILQQWGRYQIIERSMLSNFYFAKDDIIITLGQDGLVANTLKYLEGQPVIGINPDPQRWDGILLPFTAKDLNKLLLHDVARNKLQTKAISMAQATLSDGQVIKAVNDIFIGPINHTSASYEIALGTHQEMQISSGVIISTGLGSTAWLKSIITGSMAIAHAYNDTISQTYQPIPWDTKELTFVVREPFPSRHSQAKLVMGQVKPKHPLILRSQMAEHGVIFSDGMHSDYLQFNAGIQATIQVAATQGQLVA